MDHQISSELPPVQVPGRSEQLTPQSNEVIQAEHSKESEAAIATEQQPQSGPPRAAAQQFATPAAIPGAPAPQIAIPTAGLPQIADDADLIEKEWVQKAKEIVARTRHDPYEQNKEVTRMKADYMKKRYNKDVKTPED